MTRRIGRAALLLLAAAGLGACRSGEPAEAEPAEAEPAERALQGSVGSLRELGEWTWGALVAGDTARLERVRLTEREHNELVWPRLPASAPELNMPVDFAWQNLQARSYRDRERLMARHTGREESLVDARCPEEAQASEGFRVLEGCFLVVRGGAGETRVVLFDEVLEMDGEYKIFRYRAD